ncbi:hypothetical protein CMO96_01000 [Candidatus Woesebacteria bacterium]|nr:hypothetical protein [Candidatus Woesebacteria bacterium]|tara:strand:+ start:456 stop:1322 length:867 start_codon:yes stop_codon:yes gene_type:complete
MAPADINRLQEILTGAKSVLIVLSQNPSLDSVASGLALGLALEKSGLITTISSPGTMTVEFNRLVGVDKVRASLGENNLVISFVDFPPEGIDRVSYDIESGQFTLSIMPKPGNTAPTKEQIRASYSGGSYDFVIVVGANYPEEIGEFAQKKEVFEKENVVLLSNTPLSGWTQPVEIIDPTKASISEVTNWVISQLKLPLNEDIATNLFLGIQAGTQNFTAKNVSADTFTEAAQLLQNGAQMDIPSAVPQEEVGVSPQPGAPSTVGQEEAKQQGPDWPQPGSLKGPALP